MNLIISDDHPNQFEAGTIDPLANVHNAQSLTVCQDVGEPGQAGMRFYEHHLCWL